MASQPHVVTLPNELVDAIINFLQPRRPTQYLPASHVLTKTFLSLMRVSRAANHIASKTFARCCIHLDTEDRTLRFARCLAIANAYPNANPAHQSPFPLISAMFVESFTEWVNDGTFIIQWVPPNPELIAEDTSDDELLAHMGRDFMPISHGIRSTVAELNDFPIAIALRDIFQFVAPTLKRLVINIPLRSLYPDSDDLGVRPVLRQAFSYLVNLEEFVSVQDELYLATDRPSPEPEVWSAYWPRLQRLYLYNPNVEEDFWVSMARANDLETVMVGRADIHDGGVPTDLKSCWVSATTPDDMPITPDTIRPLNWIEVDMAMFHTRYRAHKEHWKRMDPQERFKVRLADVPNPYAGDVDEGMGAPRDHVHEWVKTRALYGILWDERWTGLRPPYETDESALHG